MGVYLIFLIDLVTTLYGWYRKYCAVD